MMNPGFYLLCFEKKLKLVFRNLLGIVSFAQPFVVSTSNQLYTVSTKTYMILRYKQNCFNPSRKRQKTSQVHVQIIQVPFSGNLNQRFQSFLLHFNWRFFTKPFFAQCTNFTHRDIFVQPFLLLTLKKSQNISHFSVIMSKHSILWA